MYDLHTIFTNFFTDLAPHFAGMIVGLLNALPALIGIAMIVGIMFWVMNSQPESNQGENQDVHD